MTDRRRRFIDAFLARGTRAFLNATHAAEAAGYRWPDKQGPRLLTVPEVRAEVEARFRAMAPGLIRSPMHVGKTREKAVSGANFTATTCSRQTSRR